MDNGGGEQWPRGAQHADPPNLHRVEVRDELILAHLAGGRVRKTLKPVERARAYRALMDSFGMNQSEVAQFLNMAKSDVTKTLALLKLPEDVQESIDAGEISRGIGYELTKVAEPAEQARLAELARGGLVTREEVQGAASTRSKSSKYPIKVPNGEVLVTLMQPNADIADVLEAVRHAVRRLELKPTPNATGQEAAKFTGRNRPPSESTRGVPDVRVRHPPF